MKSIKQRSFCLGSALLAIPIIVLISFSSSSPVDSGSLQFSSPTYCTSEDAGSITIAVTREGGSEGEVGVDYATSDGTATAGDDYTTASGTLTFPDGDMTPQTFSIPILDDVEYDPGETVNLTLSNPTGGATLGDPSTAVFTIKDDDNDGLPTLSQWVLIFLALSVAGFFVWQLKRRKAAVSLR